MEKAFWVGIGGAIGAVLRYIITEHVQEQIKVGAFPYRTLAVNVIGCLLIGFFSQVARTYYG